MHGYRRGVGAEPGADRAAGRIVGLLADPVRLKVVAALALGAGTIVEVARVAGLPLKDVALAARRLARAGLVRRDGHVLTLLAERFGEAARAAAEGAPPPPALSDDPAEDAVLQAFLREGRLVSVPAQQSKRLVVLDHIVRVFEPGVRYPEREVNALLRAWYPDVAALRRYLVDEGLLTRDAGVYWRSGGRVDL
ncbi:MAG: putative regulator, ArsR family [Modestobacter sp.]|jgi:hypothetical protein|nr:putative regulator, ArsR family [Modestobacter sp.]